jgi:nucleoside-diphosphate-sugar epimerase
MGALVKVVCVTGATGFIGKHLVQELLKTGNKIRILSRGGKTVPENVESYIGDLINPGDNIKNFLKDCDIIFHCAGEIKDYNIMEKLHISGTQNLLHLVNAETNRSRKKIHWVQLSSVGAYGPPKNRVDEKREINELSPTSPANIYEITKTKSDEILLNFTNEVESISHSILRPSNVFGADMTNNSLNKLISLVQKRLFFYVGGKDAVATYVHVKDVCKALILLGNNLSAKNKIYILSNDCLLNDLVKEIALTLNVKVPKIRIPLTIINVIMKIFKVFFSKMFLIPRLDLLALRTRYNVSKIQSELGFEFDYPMPYSIKLMIHKNNDI